MKLERFLLVQLRDKSAIFYSAENANAYESGPWPLCSWERHSCKFADYWTLAVSMPPTKLHLQCKATVTVRWKTCERCDHVFRSKLKAECNLREKAMKRVTAVESDSVKSARKAKHKLHKDCERASET